MFGVVSVAAAHFVEQFVVQLVDIESESVPARQQILKVEQKFAARAGAANKILDSSLLFAVWLVHMVAENRMELAGNRMVFVGNHMEFVGNRMELAANHMEFVGNRTELAGNRMELAEYRMELAEYRTELAGNLLSTAQTGSLHIPNELSLFGIPFQLSSYLWRMWHQQMGPDAVSQLDKTVQQEPSFGRSL